MAQPPLVGPLGATWHVTITQLSRSTWSFFVESNRGQQMQWINHPCSAGGCAIDGQGTYVQCLRVPSSPWRCVAGTSYASNGFMLAVTPMVTQQFAFSQGPANSFLAPDPLYRLFSRPSRTLGRLRCMSASQLRTSGAVNKVVTWCVTRSGIPALLVGDHGVPALFQSLRLVAVAPAESTMLEPFGVPVPGDALEQLVR